MDADIREPHSGLGFREGLDLGRESRQPGTCREGLEQDGQLCYEQCKEDYDGNGPVCWANCPAGFEDVGAFCQKPAPYGRGGGYPAWDLAVCEATAGKGGCEFSGALIYPKCKPGFHASGCCVCTPDCPAGWADTGTGCTKPSYGRGAGEPFSCAPGQERDGLLCYPECEAGWYGDGPLCWKSCPANATEVQVTGQNVKNDCGIGCTLNTDECVKALTDMISAPINLAANIVTFGLSGAAKSAATTAANAGAKAVVGGAANVTSGVTNAALGTGYSRLMAALTKAEDVFDKITTVKDKVEYIMANVPSLATEIDRWTSQVETGFAEFTSLKVASTIDQQFPDANDRVYIKKKWALCQLTTMIEADQWRISKEVMSWASFEPVGVVATIDAFAQPVCRVGAIPFPAITLIPQDRRVLDHSMPR